MHATTLRPYCLLIAAAAAAQIPSSSLWEWRTPGPPDIAPDGRRVVYALERANQQTDAFFSNLWLASTDGKDHRPLTTGDFRDSAPQFSPDGARVAYLTNRSGRTQLHVRWLDGLNETQVTHGESGPQSFAWSPDGRSIAYTARVTAEPEFKLDLAKAPKGAKWAEPATVVTRLKWRADRTPGQGIVENGETHIFVVPADGGAPRRLTAPGMSFQGAPSWTPDGKSLVAAADKFPQADSQLYPTDIYVISLAGGEPRRLTSRNGPESNPAVSPDGAWVAFLGFEDKGQAHHVTLLHIVPTAGGEPQRLSAKLDRNVLSPVWTADSKSILAVVEDRGIAHVHAFNLKGDSKPLTSGNVRYATAYAASESIAVSRTGQVALTRSAYLEPKDIWHFHAANPATATRLTHSNDAVLEAHKPGKVEEVLYKSFDGREMQGWAIFPPDFDPAKKYPLILDIHGGPHAMYGVEFNWQMQTWAARGYVVLYTNPRGSTGYGEAFGDIIHAKYPGDDYKDLMAGVDAMIAKGSIDPARLYVTGGSGGGILTAWTVTQTTRFRAAVSQYPVINWITQAGSSDIPLAMHRWMKGTPWENTKQYLERSPLFFAGNVKTPTMLLTGEEDWRTPIAQTEEFYVALKTRGVDTVMVRFPNEPHGIRGRHPSHRVAKADYIVGWFDRHK
ncbi:MAG: S9 family peptidase [Bryobacteraceae bacterium]